MPAKCPNILTDREKDVLINFCFTSLEISQKLNIAPSTIKMHTDNILSKLHCKSKAAALLEAIKLELIELQDINIKRI